MSDELKRVNTPDDGLTMEIISETHTTWVVDAEREGFPTPKMFRDLGAAGNKMVVLSTFLPEAYQAEAERIYSDIVRLQHMLARERLDDDQEIADLCLGNLEALPEVEAEREQRRPNEEADLDG